MLYQYESEDIRVSIEARWEGDSLIIDGYDIGKRVKQYWGDSDYEYSVSVPPRGVAQLCEIFGVTSENKKGILDALAFRYHSNSAYSDIVKLLDENKIRYEGFSWI